MEVGGLGKGSLVGGECSFGASPLSNIRTSTLCKQPLIPHPQHSELWVWGFENKHYRLFLVFGFGGINGVRLGLVRLGLAALQH